MGSCMTAMRLKIWPSNASEIILCCKICLKGEASAYSTAAVFRVNMVGKDRLTPEALSLLARRMRIAKQNACFKAENNVPVETVNRWQPLGVVCWHDWQGYSSDPLASYSTSASTPYWKAHRTQGGSVGDQLQNIMQNVNSFAPNNRI